MVYLNMVWTATMVLQSARVSSRDELELSLLTMTTLSARLMPARSKSSKLLIIAVCLTNLSIYYKVCNNWRLLGTFSIKLSKKFHIHTSQLNQSSSKPLGRNILFPRSSVQAWKKKTRLVFRYYDQKTLFTFWRGKILFRILQSIWIYMDKPSFPWTVTEGTNIMSIKNAIEETYGIKFTRMGVGVLTS